MRLTLHFWVEFTSMLRKICFSLMKCMMLKMKLNCKNGRTKDILGHHQELLQYSGMDVAPTGATRMDAIAKKMVSIPVMEMMTGHMVHVVER